LSALEDRKLLLALQAFPGRLSPP